MDLVDWIKQVGTAKVAKMLNVSQETVAQWRRCDTSPKTMTAYEIIQKTHEMLDWEDIYMPYVRAQLANSDPNQMKLDIKE